MRLNVVGSISRVGQGAAQRRRRGIYALVSALVILLLAACGTVDQTELPSEDPLEPDSTSVSWTGVDVGVVAVPGRAEEVGEELRVLAAGEDIWASEDSFFFVQVPAEGDVDVRARVGVTDAPDAWAKAGVMVRGGLAADSSHAFLGVTPGGALEFIWRAADGSGSESKVVQQADYSGWVRLLRSGGAVTAFTSADGVAWEEFGATSVNLPQAAHAGVAVTSKVADSPAEAFAQQVSVNQARLPGDPADPQPQPQPNPEPTPEPQPTPTPGAGPWVCPSAPLIPAYQPTLFVATNGSDSNDGRSEARPLRSISRAASLARAGDVVWVRGGVYHEAVDFRQSGTASNPIVFESYPGECAIIDGDSLASNRRAVTLSGVQHMVFRNFKVRNSHMEGIFLAQAHNNEISHVEVHDNFWSGITLSGSNDNIMSHFISHSNYDPPHGGDADGVNINSGRNNRVEYCMVHDNSDDGIDTWRSTGTVVDHCVAHDNGWQGGDGNGFKAGGGIDARTVVQNSIAFHNKANGFDHNQGRQISFLNNTGYDNGMDNFRGNDTTTLRNNLSYSGRNSVDEAIDSHNSWNLRITNPRFVSTDPGSPDFLTLSGNSPAIGAGTDVGIPFAGPAPDLGAIPYGSSFQEAFRWSP